MIPGPKLPNITLPSVRSIPSIPFVGCAGASGTTYFGGQFGNLPDLNAVQHIKTLQKALLEQIFALIEGQLPDPARPIPYAARALQLTNELTELVSTLNEMIGRITEEANDAMTFASGKINEVNAAVAEIESLPQGTLGPVQQLMVQRYGRYGDELAAQVTRLQLTIECVAG